MAPDANGGDSNGGIAMEAAQNKKPRKRKKSRSSSRWATRSATSSSLPTAGDGNGGGQQRQPVVAALQQQHLHRGKQRVVWTPELHDVFLKACNVLGKAIFPPDACLYLNAVPKKILALMNVDGISREHVASHLQKHRLNLKPEEQPLQRVPGRGDERPPLHAEASSQTPLPSLHPPAQAPAASSPADCFITSSSSSSVPTNLLLHPHPGFPMVQPIQQRFTPPLEATVVMPMPPKKHVKKRQAGYNNATMQQLAAAAASGHNSMILIRDNVAQTLARAPQMQAPRFVSMTGEISVPEANLINDEANMVNNEETEICMAHLLMAVGAEEGQGRPAGREAPSEMAAATVEEGQGQAAEPGAAETAAKAEEEQDRYAEPGGNADAAAGSLSPPGSSVHGEYWKIDDTDVSWDFCGFHYRYNSD